MSHIHGLLTDYLNHLEVGKNYSPKTREAYERYLRMFIKFINVETPEEINIKNVDSFRMYLAHQKNSKGDFVKKSTQGYYMIALRNFLKYLIKKDLKVLAPEKIELPKIPMRQIDILSYEDMERLLEAPGNDSNLKTLRDKAILEIFFSTGLRISELCALPRYIDIERGEISIRGKGSKLRMVFLSKRAKKNLEDYLKKRTDTEPALFISLRKANNPKILGRITSRAVQRLVNFWSRKAGLGKIVTPHQLRHQFATDLLMNGADLRSVQELLGHQNISTTQVYTHVTNQKLQEVHKTFHGKRRRV